MLKRTYNVIYRVRPNKKTVGVRHVQNMTFRGRLEGNGENAAKLLRSLCAIHRVNPDAILLDRIELILVTYDAVVDPNNDNEIINIFDNSDCRDCDGECSTQEVEVPDDFDLETDFYKEAQ